MTWLYRLSRILPAIVYSRCGILLKEVHCLHIGQWWKEDNAYIAPLAFSGRSSGIFSHANPVNWFERELWKLVSKFINKTNFGQCIQDLIRFCRSWVEIATYQCYQHYFFPKGCFLVMMKKLGYTAVIILSRDPSQVHLTCYLKRLVFGHSVPQLEQDKSNLEQKNQVQSTTCKRAWYFKRTFFKAKALYWQALRFHNVHSSVKVNAIA